MAFTVPKDKRKLFIRDWWSEAVARGVEEFLRANGLGRLAGGLSSCSTESWSDGRRNKASLGRSH